MTILAYGLLPDGSLLPNYGSVLSPVMTEASASEGRGKEAEGRRKVLHPLPLKDTGSPLSYVITLAEEGAYKIRM